MMKWRLIFSRVETIGNLSSVPGTLVVKYLSRKDLVSIPEESWADRLRESRNNTNGGDANNDLPTVKVHHD